jgi:hypothetical protein
METTTMARSKPISVKIATAKVIKALETKLAETKANYAKQDENEAKFQLKVDAWKKELFAFALANLDKAENTRTNYRSYSQNLNVDFDISVKEGEFPKSLKRTTSKSTLTLIVSRKRKWKTLSVSLK